MESDIERLFHFTDEESLKSILKSKEFWVMYCEEDHTFLNEADQFKYFDFDDSGESLVKNRIINRVAYPMVCFCDIPRGKRLKEHCKKYKSYGIAMKRDWAKENKISPVQYVHSNGLTAQFWFNLLTQEEAIRTLIKEGQEGCENLYFNNLFSLATFIKPYQGLVDGEIRYFYNEREWRYYPKCQPEERGRIYLKNEQINEVFYRKGKKSDFKLPFEYKDVDKIIVPSLEAKGVITTLLKGIGVEKIKIEIL